MMGSASTRAVVASLTAMTLCASTAPSAHGREPGATRGSPPVITPCAGVEHRLQGQPSGALRAVVRQLGVTLALDVDGISGPLRAARERVVTPHGPLDVLTVSDSGGRELQHLVLREDGGRGRCHLVSALAVPAATTAEPAVSAVPPAAPPTHVVVRLAGGAAALVVRAPVRGGTGLLLVRERWHLLDPRGVRTVLDVPVRGLMEGWPSTFDRAFETRVLPAGGEAGVTEVRATISASFTTGSYIYWMPVEPLFSIRRTAYFTWRAGAGRLVLDAARSDIYEDEIEGLFEDAEEQFLRHHVSELIRLAGAGTPGQRRWLRHFLDAVADGPERRAVMEALP